MSGIKHCIVHGSGIFTELRISSRKSISGKVSVSMVVANEPTVVDFVVVIEATANMVAHWNAIKKKYILPAVEYFNGRRPSPTDYIGNNSSSQFGYVLFHSYDSSAELFTSCSSVTQSPWDFVHSLDSISFSGGGCEKCSSIAEGLGRALQVFDDLAHRRVNRQSTKVCLLVCNSPPYDLPCYENYMYAGHKSENLAEHMRKKGIHLSVISPQHIPQVKQLYLAANNNQSKTQNCAQDSRHLVLISGFTLPTEQDPIKVEPTEEVVPAKISAVTHNATATSSVPSATVQHPSPGSSFNHPNLGIAVNSPAGLMQTSNPVSQTLSCDLKFSAGTPSLSTAQNSNGLIVSSGMNASASGILASVTSKQQTTVNMMVNQQQQQMPSYSTDGNISQPVSNSSFSRPSLSQNSASGNLMTNARIGANTVSSNMKDMVKPGMNQSQSCEAQMRMPDMPAFPTQQANPMHSNNMRPNTVTSGSPANGGSQGMFSPQSAIKMTVIPDQKRMTPQSVASHLTESSAIRTSTNMPLTSAYSNPSPNSNNMQIGQVQQKNPLVSVTSNETLSSFSVSPSNSIQQMNSTMNNVQSMINRGNNIRPSMPQTPLMASTSGNMSMITSNDQQIASSSIQVEQPMNRPQSIMSNNVGTRMANPLMNSMPNNDQAPNVVVLPNQPNGVPLWRGILEWKEKRRVPSGTSERTTHHLQCEIFARPNQNDDALNVTSWPNTLTMQLVPHVVFSYRNLKAQIKNHISVSLRMTPIDQMKHLASTMQNKWMGVVQTQSTPNPQAENRVMLVLYSQKNNHFVGLLPRDPATFISTIKQVIHMHQNQPRQPNPGGPQLVQPLQNVGPSQFPPDTRMPTQSVSNQNHFIVQSNRNTNPVMKPMNQMPVQQHRGLTNSNMQVRQSIQMQPGVNTQSRMGFSSTVQRMPGNGQMANPQSVQIQQQGNMGAQMQQGGVGNQQYMYQNNMNPRQMSPSTPAMNQSNPDMVRQQQLQRIRMQQQQQQQSQQFSRINQMPLSHNAGEEELRSLLQQAGNSMTQGMNQQRPVIHRPSQGMRQMPQGSVRPNYTSNQPMRHPMQSNPMMGMQQQRFGTGM